MKPTLFFFTLFLIILSLSCSKSSDPINNCNNRTFDQEFQDELSAVSDATVIYANNPTPENCEKFRSAYLDYIDAIEDWEECAVLANQEAEWRAALDSARQSAEDLNC